MKVAPCPNCRSEEQYISTPVSSGGGYAPNYLPDLGSFFKAGKFRLVMCRACGAHGGTGCEESKRRPPPRALRELRV
jgi:hypothetical protein